VGDVRYPAPARLLDVPDEFTPQLVSWGNEIVGATDPDYARVLIDSPEAEKYSHLPFRSPASIEIFEYGRKLAAERRGGDGDDLVSRLVNRIPDDGIPLTPTDLDNYFLLLVVAGNETTRQAISHAMKALMDHPDQLAFLRDNPDKSQIAVEELLRFASPVYHFRRTSTRDVEMGGQQIKAGDKVACGSQLLAAVEQRCASWPTGALHLERFAAKAAEPDARAEKPFELVLARSGLTLTVPSGKSVFNVVQEAGVSVLGSCHEGICGTCEQIVLDGDVGMSCSTPAERGPGCGSRSSSRRSATASAGCSGGSAAISASATAPRRLVWPRCSSRTTRPFPPPWRQCSR
jgi:ferredoxin